MDLDFTFLEKSSATYRETIDLLKEKHPATSILLDVRDPIRIGQFRTDNIFGLFFIPTHHIQ